MHRNAFLLIFAVSRAALHLRPVDPHSADIRVPLTRCRTEFVVRTAFLCWFSSYSPSRTSKFIFVVSNFAFYTRAALHLRPRSSLLPRPAIHSHAAELSWGYVQPFVFLVLCSASLSPSPKSEFIFLVSNFAFYSIDVEERIRCDAERKDNTLDEKASKLRGTYKCSLLGFPRRLAFEKAEFIFLVSNVALSQHWRWPATLNE